PTGSELATDWTLFFLSQKLPTDDDGRIFETNTGNNLWAAWGPYTNSIYLEGSPSNYNSGIATTTGIRNWHLHSYKRTSGTGQVEARADGLTLTTFAGTNSASDLRVDIEQGAFSSSGESSDARVGEMILYNSSLTATEVNKIESYLGIKYGLTMAHDYLATDGSIIWNKTTNATYHNDVAGIGRDDNTALDQRKSQSVNTTAALLTLDKGGAFGTDKSFIVWGSDGATGVGTNVPLPSPPSPFSARTNRVWKVAVTGVPGAVNFSVDLSIRS